MDSYVKDLIEVGLTENEAKVYCCLMKKELFTASEIARCTSVNRSKVYVVLSCLMQKGLVIEKLGSVKKYSAISPDLAFKKLIKAQESRLAKLKNIPERLKTIYNDKQLNASPLDFIEVFSTPSSIINKHHNLELNSTDSVLSFCKKPYAMTRSLIIHETQKKTMKKGVVFRSIYEAEWDDLDFFCQSMQNFVKAGEEIRISLHLPVKLHIFDNKVAMFSMQNHLDTNAHLTYLVIEHGDMTEMLISTFNKYWEESLTINQFLKRYSGELSISEQKLQH